MAFVQDEGNLLGLAQVTAEPFGIFYDDTGEIKAWASVSGATISVYGSEDGGILRGSASLTVDLVVMPAETLTLLASASVSVEEEIVSVQGDLTLLATASLDLGLPLDEEASLGAAADVIVEDTGSTSSPAFSAGGVGPGVGATVRVRPDGGQRLTPTTNRRTTLFTGS